MNTRRRVALMVACLLVSVAGVGEHSTAQVSGDDRAAIQDLLDERARAVTERDKQAFLATVDPTSEEFFREQARFFDSLATVPLEGYTLRARWDRLGDLVRPADRRAYVDADDVAIPLTEERYRVRNFDRSPAVEDMFFTFVKRDGDWLIADDTDLNDLAFYTGRHLWDFGSLYRVTSKHFVVYGHRCEPNDETNLCPARARSFLALAEEALQQVGRYWTAPWSHRVVVLVPETERELKRILQITFDPSDFVAFAYSTVDVDRGIRYTGHRIIFNWRSLRDRSDAEIRTILAHELVHVASRDLSGPFIPIFLDEGIAEYIGHDADPSSLAFLNAEVASGIFDGRLPEDFEFITGSGTSIYRSYQEGQSAVDYFVARYGVRDLIALYRRLGISLAPGTARYHLDRALMRFTGSDEERFEDAWADSIT